MAADKTNGKITRATLAGMIDHAVLKPTATLEDLIAACDLADRCKVAGLCVRPCDVAAAAERLAGSGVAVGTVIAFPHGTAATEIKAAEAAQAVADGADELDMVINIARLLDGDMDNVRRDIAAVVRAAKGRVVKVIMECCYLDRERKLAACQAIAAAGAHFAKTSTGFGASGARVDDVCLLRANLPAEVGVKAAGGIASLADALAMIKAGANRIGTSKTESILAGIPHS